MTVSVYPKTILTIGNFDGVHRGHQSLLKRVNEIAQQNPAEFRKVALSFEPHPIEVLRPGIVVERLSPPAYKETLLKSYGIDEVALWTFDLNLASNSPEDFFRKIIVEKFDARFLVVGAGFKFGNSQSGDSQTLRELGSRYGVQIEVLQNATDSEGVISSSRIRKALMLGDLESVTQLLGRPHRLIGTVVHGQKRGSQIGVPTANLRVTSSCKRCALPKTGVYVTRSYLGPTSVGIDSVTNIGTKPTVDAANQELSVETHVLQTVGDLYGKTMSVEFLYRIRDEMRFPSIEALSEQIRKDIAFSKSYLAEK